MGCHRTGTTLMRLVLNSHKNIHCFDEWKGYNAVLNQDFENPKNSLMVGFKAPNWTEYFVESDHYKKFYNNDPIIFMLRDVRATIASMLTLKTGGKGNFFYNVLEAIDVKWPKDDHRAFKRTHTEEVKQIEAMNEMEFRKAALFWRVKTSRYLEMVKLKYKVLPVNYDLFVKNPKDHLKIITNFLEIEWDNNLLFHHTREHDETFNGIAVGDTLVTRPIDINSTTKWKTILTAEQEKAILETAGEWNNYVFTLV